MAESTFWEVEQNESFSELARLTSKLSLSVPSPSSVAVRAGGPKLVVGVVLSSPGIVDERSVNGVVGVPCGCKDGGSTGFLMDSSLAFASFFPAELERRDPPREEERSERRSPVFELDELR